MNYGIPQLDRNRHRKICFYGRVSTEHEAQLSALQNQMQWYDDQLEKHNNWELVDKYIDEGITGTQAKKRPAFLKMIEDAKNGKFDLIVTREVCRFARNTVDTLMYTRELSSKYGVEVFFAEDNIWTMDNDGELRLTIMATLAQEESRKVSERVRAGQKISRDKGVLYGNGNILGYDLKRNIDENGKWNPEENTYVINEEQAETVKMIFDLYVSGLGCTKIAKEMERLHRKDSAGEIKWNASKITRIINRTTYKGVLSYNQSYVTNYLEQKRINNRDKDTYIEKQFDFPAIISEEQWELVQKIKAKKTQKLSTGKSRGKVGTSDIWLHKLKCKCGASFRKNKWRTNKKTNEEVFGYQCYNQLNNGSKAFREKQGLDTTGYCDIRMIGDWKLDLMAKYVIDKIWNDRINSVEKAYEMILECYEEDGVAGKAKDKLENEIRKVNTRISNLIEMRSDGEITKAEFIASKKKCDDKLIELEIKLSECNDEDNTKTILEEKLRRIREALEEAIDFSQHKLPDYVIDKFIQKIVPLDNDTYRWYVNLTGSVLDGEQYEHEFDLGIKGRKNKAEVFFYDESSLSDRQYDTGSYISEIGELRAYKYRISFEDARAYRKSCGNYLRCNQWNDIIIEIFIV